MDIVIRLSKRAQQNDGADALNLGNLESVAINVSGFLQGHGTITWPYSTRYHRDLPLIKETRCKVTAGHLLEGRNLSGTNLFCKEASRVKAAAGGRINGAGHIAGQNGPVALLSGVGHRRCGKQCPGVGVERCLVDRV